MKEIKDITFIKQAWDSLPDTLKLPYRIVRNNLVTRQYNAQLKKIRAMRLEFEKDLLPINSVDPPKRFLFNSQFSWPYGWVEYSLATILRLRGHQVTMIACGGLPSYCELEQRHQSRPPCDLCFQNLQQHFEAFDLPYYVARDFLTEEDVSQAHERAFGESVAALLSLQIHGVSVGTLAQFNLYQYFKGHPFEIHGEHEAVFRRCIESGILIATAMKRISETYRPDMVITTSGKVLQWAPIVRLAEQQGIPYVTWEDSGITSGTVVAVNQNALEQTIHPETWMKESQHPLSRAERAQLQRHFQLWEQSETTPFTYYDESKIEDIETIKQILNLSEERPIVSLFPNIMRESSILGIEKAFTNMFEWLFAVVDYARSRPDVLFIIRAHPAERSLPEPYQHAVTSTPVCEEIATRCPPLPQNLRLVYDTSPISSYALASISNVVMTYASTLGLELALRGQRPWIAADVYYAGKGFTLDLESAQHMYDLLNHNTFENRLTPIQIDLAERLAYITCFRRTFKFPYLASREQGNTFNPPNFNVFLPGGNPIFDNLYEYLLGRRSELDIGPREFVR